MYIKWSHVEFSELCISAPEGCFSLANSADHNEMQHYAAFYLGLHSLLNNTFKGFPVHGLQSRPPSPNSAERKVRGRPFREAGSGHKQWNTVSCVDTLSLRCKFSAQNSKI